MRIKKRRAHGKRKANFVMDKLEENEVGFFNQIYDGSYFFKPSKKSVNSLFLITISPTTVAVGVISMFTVFLVAMACLLCPNYNKKANLRQ